MSRGTEFVIADLHLCPPGSGHYRNIAMYEDRPDGWDELIFSLWNETVGKDDTVVVVGDFALAGIDYVEGAVARLNGRKVLLLGNHDGSRSRMLRAGFDEVMGSRSGAMYSDPDRGRVQYRAEWATQDGGIVTLSHAPSPALLPGTTLNYHGHIHTNPYPDGMGGRRPWHRNVSVEAVGYRPVPLVSR